MGILDSLANIAERHPDTNDQQHASLIQTAMQMFGNRAGLSDLVNKANSQGLGHIVQSWIGAGSNQPIGPAQLQGLLGQDRLNELASRSGVPPAIASGKSYK